MSVTWHGDAVTRKVKGLLVDKLNIVCARLEKDIKESMVHPPPAPAGEPPAVRTGRLRASITFEVDKGNLVGRVGSDVEYAPYLELGTVYMEPRPYLRRQLHQNRDWIRKQFGAR